MCFEPLSKICHWGPLVALGIIKFVTGVTLYCSGMWWPSTTWGGFINTCCFMSVSGITLYNFLSSMFHGPGYLPFEWKPASQSDYKYLQLCGVCKGFKAPRAHHCRRCGRCVLKMDHHCPWINNCVGWGNHGHFTAFLTFAVFGCMHATIVLGFSLYRAINRSWYLYYGIKDVPIVQFNVYGLLLCLLALGLAVGVVIAVGILLFFQLRAIVRNRTGIEDWILEKAVQRRRDADDQFIYPYDLGWWRNIKQVINITCEPLGDGIEWPVVEGCDRYTLTIEQIQQKAQKRQRTRLYAITEAASGYWFPFTKGFMVCINPPCTDEPRIQLTAGDTVMVTRWRKHWLFGEKVDSSIPLEELSTFRVRGWFPRKCATEMNKTDSNTSVLLNKKLN